MRVRHNGERCQLAAGPSKPEVKDIFDDCNIWQQARTRGPTYKL
ncbi:tRNA lysidine(34) synthetase TilS [Lacipirellula parvula]